MYIGTLQKSSRLCEEGSNDAFHRTGSWRAPARRGEIEQQRNTEMNDEENSENNPKAVAIANAIAEKKIIYLRYGGYRRKVIPTTLGYTKAGTLSFRAYQVESQYRTGADWINGSLRGVDSILPFTESFDANPPNYQRGESGMIRIVAEL